MTTRGNGHSRSDPESSPWLCHVCATSSSGPSITCDLCFRTVCPAHVRRTPMLNHESGLYEPVTICVLCIAEKATGLT